MPQRVLKYFLHPLCFVGGVFAAVGFGASLFALIVDLRQGTSSPYQGILTFAVYPSVFIFGLCVVAVGLYLERRRRKRLESEHRPWTPHLDPRLRRHRRILLGLALFAAFAVFTSVLGAYHAYEFTESPEFCGVTCHTPMEPEYVTYQNSPHANIGCATCHVGAGVRGFVEAKFAGLEQLWQMVGAKYPRPIHASTRKVEITSETCENCHWRKKYWGPRLDAYSRYGYDIQNSERQLRVLTRPGGASDLTGNSYGAHWHTSSDARVTFRAADARNKVIPWVRVERADGTSVVYEDPSWPPEEASGATLLEERRITCIDCHSRPAHRFRSPDDAINQALAEGSIDRSLPSIKRLGVAALGRRYATRDEAREGIRAEVESYYRNHFEGMVLGRQQSLESAISQLIRIHEQNFFPLMQVNWQTHADHTGHRESAGCFRCHTGRHVSQEGKRISQDCALCHEFFMRERDSETLVQVPADGSSFHPFRHEEHNKIGCWDCHGGGASPYEDCESCHEGTMAGHAMQFECSICHRPGEEEVTSATCVPCHPAGESEMHALSDHGDCLACHQPHGWEVANTESCVPCHETIAEVAWREHYAEQKKDCVACHEFRGALAHMMGLPVKRD